MNKTLSPIGFRFLFLLCITFIFLYNNESFTFLAPLFRFTYDWQSALVIWFGNHILHLSHPIEIQANGSGDTTYSYVLLLIIFIFSFIGTVVWSALDYKRSAYPKLHYWLITIIRFYVGFMLVHYGLAKLNNGQFPGPSPIGMNATYGDSSPMGLAWRFLGYSEGYKTFMFVAEMMGVLLFFRRTATIGAMLCLMTSLNIMAINYFFDVPVKILSTALVFLCLVILSPNLIRLFRLFFMGETVQLNELQPPAFRKKWKTITLISLKYLAITICAVIPVISTAYTSITKQPEAKEALYGAYEIRSIEWPASAPAPDSTYLSHKWYRIILDRYDRALIKFGNEQLIYCKAQIETDKKTLKLSFNDEPGVRYTLTYWSPMPNTLELKGELFGKPVTINLEKIDYELTKQGFRWINEFPSNK
ncbi:putative membrane protein YphA (DoxX/SURF4 family) [Pedobacter sp. UYP24]